MESLWPRSARRANVHRDFLGLRCHAKLVRAAETLQSALGPNCRPERFHRHSICALAGPGKRRDGDAAMTIWESKYHYDFWRPITGIRESDGPGPTYRGDGNPDTIGDRRFMPLGAPASNLTGPNFTPPFPAYPSGHAGVRRCCSSK